MSKFLNKIVNGNSLEILKTIPNKTFDLVFADPPYNLQIGKKLKRPDDSKVNGVNDKWDQFKSFDDYDNFCKKWLTECKRVDRKSTRLNSSHKPISYAVFCLKKKKKHYTIAKTTIKIKTIVHYHS